jgi:methyl-accepting chemotaxis protein
MRCSVIQSIKSKVVVAGAVILILSGATSGAGLWTAATLGAALDRSTASAQALRDATLADMMHDAIRSDVLTALINASSDAPGARPELPAHIAALQSSLASARRQTADRAGRQALDDLAQPLANYTAAAERVVALARTDPRAAAAALVAFNAAFIEMEGRMMTVGDGLETASAEAIKDARGQTSMGELMMVISLIAGLVLSAGLILGSQLMVIRPLGALSATLKALSEGRANVVLSGTARTDELGIISRAVVAFQALIVARAGEASKGAADAAAVMVAAKRNQAVIEFDLSGSILDANENFLKAVGYSLSEVVGRHHRMFVAADYAGSPQYSDFWQRLKAGEFVSDKFVRFGRGGTRLVLDAVYNPILGPDGRPYKVIKFATDITVAEAERLRVQDLQESAAAEQSEIVAETGRGLKALAAGDLSFRIDHDFPGEYARLKADFNVAMDKLEDAMGVISANASAMQTGSGEISQAADDLSRRTEQQAATLEETAAALDQITATVRRTAEGAQRANVVVADARQDAETSGQVVTRAVAAMGEIQKSAEQISQIIGVIDEIAFQTNLLALNAGVEAARAGDAGRGFAVVASEVRALAQRSAEAAKEIKSLISSSTSQVRDGVGLVGQTGEALTAIVGRVSEINSLMSEINASAQEQATALSEVNTAVNQMDQTTQQNAAMVEQSTAASHNLSQEAGELAQLVGRFKIGSAPAARSPRQPSRATHPVREAQARIGDFASQLAPRRSGSAALALAPSNEAEWEEF